jgi:prepilin-type processing-associated H-X9-DG protein
MSSADDQPRKEMFPHTPPDETKDSVEHGCEPQLARRPLGRPLIAGGVALFCFCVMVTFLMPAMQNARESGRRAVCANNIRNLGLAMASYETSRGAYPGYRDTISVNSTLNVGGVQTNKVPVSWLILLYPNLERARPYSTGVYYAWKHLEGVDIPAEGPIRYKFPKLDTDFGGRELFICPSDPQSLRSPGYEQPLSYVVNSGLQDVPATATPPGDWPENGVFVSRWEMPTAPDTPPLLMASTSADSVSNGDGVSLTVMLTENIEARSYSDVFLHVGQPADRGSPVRPVSEQMTCFVWFPQDPLPTDRQQMQINGTPSGPSPEKAGENPSPGVAHDITYARPSSNHPGGANFVFCDAHTQFISDNIDYLVYCLLMTSHGAKARVPGTGARFQSSGTSPFNSTKLDPDMIWQRAEVVGQ